MCRAYTLFVLDEILDEFVFELVVIENLRNCYGCRLIGQSTAVRTDYHSNVLFHLLSTEHIIANSTTHSQEGAVAAHPAIPGGMNS